jgi:hypothetical protein
MSDAYRELGQLYARLAKLDRERADVFEKIARWMSTLAGAPGSPTPHAALTPVTTPFPRSLREQIHDVIAAGGTFTSWDIAQKLGMRDRYSLRTIRSTLARLAKQGLIKRVSFGRYAV